MADDPSVWLRRRMRDRIPDLEQPAIVASLPRASVATEAAASAIELVQQAAERIGGLEARAVVLETRAKALVAAAIEKLRLAEQRFHIIDTKRRELEMQVDGANLRAREVETTLTAAESRIVQADAELSAGEERAATAETRAQEGIAALAQVEDAIRIHLLDADQSSMNQLAMAA